MAKCIWYNIFVSDFWQVCDFLWVLEFPPPINWHPWYNWNIDESGIKQHKTNPNPVRPLLSGQISDTLILYNTTELSPQDKPPLSLGYFCIAEGMDL